MIDWIWLGTPANSWSVGSRKQWCVYIFVCVCVFLVVSQQTCLCLFGDRVSVATFLKNLGCVSHCAKHLFNPLNHPTQLRGSTLYFTDEEIEAQ